MNTLSKLHFTGIIPGPQVSPPASSNLTHVIGNFRSATSVAYRRATPPTKGLPKVRIERYGRRNWAVYDHDGELIAVTVYKKGALEIIARLSLAWAELAEAIAATGQTVEEWYGERLAA